ncbi:leucine rich repeat-containing protein [Besnoitia besnoiti]|uniref:Dynein regulatory complex subunit 3 n=1 Tax=Besnoitia besnoiti TaxID=94643 RepID=A0A2A9MAE7_BESBE|nr:leucine rich repeat-containing protein [Besnoitia besnoiti]PFH32340.1 leucine rich repeat-containing protein [Besnoitia besnoiti]
MAGAGNGGSGRPPPSRASTAGGANGEITLFSDELFSRRSAPVGFASGAPGASSKTHAPLKKSDFVEPQVIDEEVLKHGVVVNSSKPVDEPADPRDFAAAESLTLSYKNIMFIANLETFTGLTTLRLDNNIIEKIENLDHLVNLEWLDLSFNNISEISGLSNLKNLTDLSLYSNKISKIGPGLEGCPKLTVLSLGRNSIADLSQINLLRRHPRLRCLNLEGNPICKAENYTPHILAFLPKLRYLDYQLIDRRKIVAAQESVQPEELNEMKKQESIEAALVEQQKKREKTFQHLAANLCEFLDNVANRFFGDTAVPVAVTVLKDFPLLKEAYLEKLEMLTTSLRQTFEQRNAGRRQRVSAYEAAVRRAVLESEAEARTLLKQMQRRKKKVEKELESYLGERREILNRISAASARPTKLLSPPLAPTQNEDSSRLARHEDFQRLLQTRGPELFEAIDGFVADVDALRFHLLTSEATLEESLEESADTLEAAVDATMKFLLDRGSDFFRNLEETEKNFSSSLLELATAELDAFPAVMDEETNELRLQHLANKDEVLAACSSFLEAHLQHLMSMEDLMQNAISTWQRQYFENERQTQYERSRKHILEIHEAAEELKAKILHCRGILVRDRDDVRRHRAGARSDSEGPTPDEDDEECAEGDSASESQDETEERESDGENAADRDP